MRFCWLRWSALVSRVCMFGVLCCCLLNGACRMQVLLGNGVVVAFRWLVLTNWTTGTNTGSGIQMLTAGVSDVSRFAKTQSWAVSLDRLAPLQRCRTPCLCGAQMSRLQGVFLSRMLNAWRGGECVSVSMLDASCAAK